MKPRWLHLIMASLLIGSALIVLSLARRAAGRTAAVAACCGMLLVPLPRQCGFAVLQLHLAVLLMTGCMFRLLGQRLDLAEGGNGAPTSLRLAAAIGLALLAVLTPWEAVLLGRGLLL